MKTRYRLTLTSVGIRMKNPEKLTMVGSVVILVTPIFRFIIDCPHIR